MDSEKIGKGSAELIFREVHITECRTPSLSGVHKEIPFLLHKASFRHGTVSSIYRIYENDWKV